MRLVVEEFKRWLDYDKSPAIAIRNKSIPKSKLENPKELEMNKAAYHTLNYQEFLADILKCAKWYNEKEEMRWGIFGSNSYEWLCFFFGGVLAGKEMLCLDMLMPLEELSRVLKLTDCQCLMLDESLDDVLTFVKKEHKECQIHNLKLPHDDMVEHLLKMMNPHSEKFHADNSGNETELDHQLTNGMGHDGSDKVDDIFILRRMLEGYDEVDEAKIMYMTSGTTSQAKCTVSYANHVFANALAMAERNPMTNEGREQTFKAYMPLPMHHIYPMISVIEHLHKKAILCVGSMYTLKPDILAFEPEAMVLVPSSLDFLIKKKLLSEKAEYISVGGAKCEDRQEEACKERGIFLQNIYGCSEASGTCAMNPVGSSVKNLKAIGGYEFKLSPEGEILFATENHMIGYLNNDKATADKIQSHVLYMGDGGALNSDGTFSVTGRMDNWIVMENGDKVSCEEIEEEINHMEGVADSTVVYKDNQLISVVILKADATKEQIDAQIQAYNQKQQVIRRLKACKIRKKDFPRNNMGKVNRKKLTEELEEL